MAKPHVIYQAKPGSALEVNREFYARLGLDAGKRTLVDRFLIPKRSGRAWPVRAGETWTSDYGELGIGGLTATFS